jgi:hypothetical protein
LSGPTFADELEGKVAGKTVVVTTTEVKTEIKVEQAFYGYLPEQSLTVFVQPILQGICGAKVSCQIPVYSSFFGFNPAPNLPRELLVRFSCPLKDKDKPKVKVASQTEGKTLTLNCAAAETEEAKGTPPSVSGEFTCGENQIPKVVPGKINATVTCVTKGSE